VTKSNTSPNKKQTHWGTKNGRFMGPWNEESKLKIIMNKYWKECYHDEFSKFFENIGCQILNWKCLQTTFNYFFMQQQM
jgi:hypothetical protein